MQAPKRQLGFSGMKTVAQTSGNEDNEFFDVDAASFTARVRHATETRRACDSMMQMAPDCSFLIGGGRRLQKGIPRSSPASQGHLIGGSRVLNVGSPPPWQHYPHEDDSFNRKYVSSSRPDNEFNGYAHEPRNHAQPHRSPLGAVGIGIDRPGRSLLVMRRAENDISPPHVRRRLPVEDTVYRDEDDYELVHLSVGSSASFASERQEVAWKSDVSAPDLTTRSYMRNTISRERKLCAHAERTRDKGLAVNWPWWRQRPLTRDDPLPIPLSPDDCWYSPEGLSGTERRRRRRRKSVGDAPTEKDATRMSATRRPLDAEKYEQIAARVRREGRLRRRSVDHGVRGTGDTRGFRSYVSSSHDVHDRSAPADGGYDKKWEREMVRERDRVMGMRHVDGLAVSRALDADISPDRGALIELVEQTNQRLKARGQRAVQRAEAWRRKILQENILAVQQRLDSSMESASSPLSHSLLAPKGASASSSADAADSAPSTWRTSLLDHDARRQGNVDEAHHHHDSQVNETTERSHQSLTKRSDEVRREEGMGKGGTTGRKLAGYGGHAPALEYGGMRANGIDYARVYGRSDELGGAGEVEGDVRPLGAGGECVHVRRLTERLKALVEAEARRGENVKGLEAASKGWHDMMVVLRRVTEAGEIMLAHAQ